MVSQMDVFSCFSTARLSIQPLTLADEKFILQLVNTEGWLRFIGNRNISSQPEAVAYIQTILANRNVEYWVVKNSADKEKMGIVTYIKRDFLQHPDIGFAFLPRFCGKGYAYEAAAAVLHQLIRQRNPTHILATTVPENISSISLLTKLGLAFEKEIEADSEKLYVYGTSADALMSYLEANKIARY